MPILINNETGMAEDVAPELVQSNLEVGSHGVPLIDPNGNHVISTHEEAAGLLGSGYTQPNEEQLTQLMDYSKFSSPTEQLKTGLEGAAEALTFGLSSPVEQEMGVNPEDMRKRRETNPGSHMLGQAVGLGAGMLTGVGEAAVLERAGAAVAEKAALAFGQGALGKIGTAATKAGIENMMFQAGDEAAKNFVNDPSQSAETALSNVGMAGLLGGAFGGALSGTGQLWAMGPGKKLEEVLSAFKNRASGLPAELKTAANIDLAPEIEAALGNNPNAKQTAALLAESGTGAGTKYTEALNNFKKQASDSVASTFAKTPEELQNLKNLDAHDVGKQFQAKLADAIKKEVEPISKKYDKFAETFKTATIDETDKLSIANDIAKIIEENGLAKGPNESALKLTSKVLEQLPLQETAADLQKYIRGLASAAPYGHENYQVAKQLRGILTRAQESVVQKSIDIGSPLMSAEYKATQAQYSQFKDLLADLNDRLHLGREAKYGATGFIEALKSMEPEAVVKRLSLKDDANLQNLLNEKFPEVAAIAKEQEINLLLKKSLAVDGLELDTNKLIKNINALPVELRKNLISEESLSRIDAIEKLLQRLPKKMNPSGTAKTLDMLWNKMPASAMGLGALLLHHNPVMGAIVGHAAQYLGREVPDAVRLSMLKFLGSGEQVSAPGFKAAVQLASAAVKGEALLNKAAAGVLNTAKMPVIELKVADREKLKKQVDEYIADPEKFTQVADSSNHYMPEHSGALAEAAVRNVQYLATLRPNNTPLGPLQENRKVSKAEETAYNQALDIANNPLLIMAYLKNGKMTLQDVKHLRAMYPGLAAKIGEKLNTQLMEAAANKQHIPYKIKLGMSVFAGGPLDPSFTSASIMAAQPQPQQASMGPGTPQAKNGTAKMDKLSKMPDSYMTPQQQRQSYRSGGR